MSREEGTRNAVKSAAMDPTDPFYVHHSDQPGHMLVLTKLNCVSYQS